MVIAAQEAFVCKESKKKGGRKGKPAAVVCCALTLACFRFKRLQVLVNFLNVLFNLHLLGEKGGGRRGRGGRREGAQVHSKQDKTRAIGRAKKQESLLAIS